MRRLGQSLATWRRRAGVPAAGVAIVHADRPPEIEVVGQRRRGDQDPVGPADRWHIGSCGKALTAALFGRLVERGDTDWLACMPELFDDVPAIDDDWREVTMTEVLTHVAGFRANLSPGELAAAYADRRPAVEQRSEVVARALAEPPRHRGRFTYSNLGYIVAGAAIERLTGRRYEDALVSSILEPLGIGSAGFGAPGGANPWGHRPRMGGIGRGPAVNPGANSAVHPADNPPVMGPASSQSG